jgi:hypothetical protein
MIAAAASQLRRRAFQLRDNVSTDDAAFSRRRP